MLLSLSIYADSTGLFSQSECEMENMVDMYFSEEVVRKWYEQHKEDLVNETSYELRKPAEECTFEDWLNEVSWSGDLDGIYDFSVENGYLPTFGIGIRDSVFYRDKDNFKYIVFTGTYDECRRFGKANNWEYHGRELEVLSDS